MSQGGNLNVLLICFYQSIWLSITIAQWWKCRACELHITSSNLPGAFVHIYWIKFLRINFLSKIAYFFTYLTYILLHQSIYNNQVIFCWFGKLFQGVLMSHLKLKEARRQCGFQQCSDSNQPSNLKSVTNF